MIYNEKTVSSKEVFSGRIIKVSVEEVELPNGETGQREIVNHPGGVGIVAVNNNDEIYLVEQFRKPLERAIYEIPAGKLDKGEAHRDCGIRELKEETGLSASMFEYMGFIYPSPGFTDEVTHVYLAQGLSQGDDNPDEDEFLDVKKVPFSTAYNMVMTGEINDAKSVFGILKYDAIKRRRDNGE